MKKEAIKYFSILMAVLLFSGCASGIKQTEEKSGEQSVVGQSKDDEKAAAGEAKNKGVAAPDFTLKDMDGNEVTLSSLQGQKVYLKFWASWCPPCKESMPALGELAAEDNDFAIYTIVAPGVGGELSEEDFKSWYKEQGYSEKIKVLFDEKGKVMQAYGITAYPTNAFIGTDGILVSKLAGAAPNESIKERIENIQ